ncbi:MAG: Cytochrome c-type biogenesis protein CcmF [Euryarchaeota archaeon UBA443]|nr:MAG: Cytochrome c-type biogenesis protein CcmF [Euryarchaeota archaeon UBA443]
MWGWTLVLAALACIIMMIWPRWRVEQPLVSVVLHLAIAAPFVALASRFIVNDTSILHVALNGGEDLPLKYRFAATWAAREGPLLMWAAWMGLVAWWFGRPLASEMDKTHQLRLRLMHGFTLLLLLIAMTLDPFAENPLGLKGVGLNELLQTDLMVIHPPLIFLAYSLCIALAATGLAILQYDDDAEIDKRMLHQTRPGILIATLGIGLGGLWAYMVLDWGGYWAWDPVETGSFLPWLALVLMGHLRTRPGKASTLMWAGLGMAAGVLALFATLVTRAGGVWATSVHTFVIPAEGAPPTNAFDRMMLLRDRVEGVEIVSYVILISLLCGVFIRAAQGTTRRPFTNLFFIPIIGALIAVLFDYSTYAYAPALFFVIMVIAPTLVDRPKFGPKDESLWSYRGFLYMPWLFIVPLVANILTEDLFFVLLNALIFTPLYSTMDTRNAWGWSAAGVMMCLASAWSGLVELHVAAIMLGFYILPWLVMGEEETESKPWLTRKNLIQVTLWAPVILTTLYIILTLVILVSSIDAIQFNAHELYGAPFIMAMALSLFTYTSRKQSPKQIVSVVFGIAFASVLFAILIPSALGGDASEPISEFLSRGTIAWLVLPSVLVALVPVGSEVFNRVKSSGFSKIAPAAHLVHFGLLLLLVGHVFTTVLVDRGDATHRITLVRGEMVEVDGYGYVFEDIVLESDGLEVGDGYVGAIISVYSGDEKIGEVEPGLIRFDGSSNPPRSEVDTLVRYHGDIVFIFDGSQTTGLMQQVSADGTDSVQRMRVIIYDLPGSHLVWAGWALMMVGMAWLTVLDARKIPHPRSEEE